MHLGEDQLASARRCCHHTGQSRAFVHLMYFPTLNLSPPSPAEFLFWGSFSLIWRVGPALLNPFLARCVRDPDAGNSTFCRARGIRNLAHKALYALQIPLIAHDCELTMTSESASDHLTAPTVAYV
jgi:hypothetical protein